MLCHGNMMGDISVSILGLSPAGADPSHPLAQQMLLLGPDSLALRISRKYDVQQAWAARDAAQLRKIRVGAVGKVPVCLERSKTVDVR